MPARPLKWIARARSEDGGQMLTSAVYNAQHEIHDVSAGSDPQ